ncbi:ABC-type multidrug transport system permease subunit [Mycobacterium frederiksbergense]|uniref:ABC-type multidrug transport system permease subunit n=1 Tax=Mycolicibacterium frederiksbergense TaxID=117567 RepID=A0ABT6L101_9MYCO|nr:ABC-type multidrug transport system permease subunit [Mycolicibacterium frederiksbergense]
MTIAVIAVIAVIGVFFLGMGLYALAAPAAILRPFGFSIETASTRAEVRAVYGGFGLAIAGVLGYAAATPGEVRTGILVTVGVALAGMAFGRIVSGLIDSRTSFYPNWFYCLVEAIGAAALFWAA